MVHISIDRFKRIAAAHEIEREKLLSDRIAKAKEQIHKDSAERRRLINRVSQKAKYHERKARVIKIQTGDVERPIIND